MQLNLNTATITSLPKKAINGVNEIGSHVSDFCKTSCDKFVKSDSVQNFSKKTGVKKETFIGAAVILAALSSGIKLITGIKNKADESKKVIQG